MICLNPNELINQFSYLRLCVYLEYKDLIFINITMSKRKNKQLYEKSTPVFRIKPDGATTAVIKYVGILNENEKLGDEIVELDKPLHPDYTIVGKHAIPFKKINDFDMIGRIYRCNIVGTHIIMSNKYPVIYIDIGYDKSIVTGSLLQIFYCIDMDKDEKKGIKELKEHKKYIDLRFTGTWHRHIDCDDELRTNYEKMITEMLENEAVEQIYKSKDQNVIEKTSSMTDEQILELIDMYVKTEKPYYDSILNDTSIEYRSLNKLRDDLINMCNTERFNKFLIIAMRCRQLHRKKERGISEDDTDYTIPKNIIKLSDIAQKMIDDDELLLESNI